MKSYFYLSIVAVCACLLTGCASTPIYHDVKASLTPQAGKGLVLFYYKSGAFGGLAKWHIYANDKVLTAKFKRGSFYSYQADPGELRLFTTKNVTYIGVLPSLFGLIPEDQPTIHIEPNETYYMEMSNDFSNANPAGGVKLKQISKEGGEEGIKDCQWINPP